jgi:HK97 family phage portal protein
VILAGPQGDQHVSLRDIAQPASSRMYVAGGGDAYSGVSVTREGALGLGAWYACASLLSEVGGTLPLRVRDRSQRNQLVRAADQSIRLEHEPNPDTPATVVWSTIIGHLVGAGNAYMLKLPASDGMTRAPELYPLLPEHTVKYRDRDRVVRYDVFAPDGSLQFRGVHHRHIIHIRGWSYGSGFMGITKVGMLRHQLGVDLAAQEYQGTQLRNGATPKGILSVDEALQEGQAGTIREQWHATYGGMENAGKIAVLDRGAKFQAVSFNAKDLQFIEQRKLSATEIAAMHRIQPGMIGAEGPSFTYANAAQNDQHFLRYALGPLLKFVTSALNRDTDLFGVRSGWEPFFDTDDIVTPDVETNWRLHGDAVDKGLMSVQTAQTRLNLPLTQEPKP